MPIPWRSFAVIAVLASVIMTLLPPTISQAKEKEDEPIVIGHRGASGYRPEHTLAAYELAIEMGADYIEPDLVSTKDRVLVARHENEISGTTDVADHPEFEDRFTTKTIDGVSISGWFTEDFTLAELKTLRAKERIPNVRPENAEHDGLYEIPTLQEVIDLVKEHGKGRKGEIGIYPETKHPSYFDSIGLSMEEELVRVLHRNGYRSSQSPVFIQSFEVSNLQDLDGMTRLPLVQLINEGGQPYDFVLSGDPRTYADLATPEGLDEIAGYADGIGPNKNLILPRDGSNNLLPPTTLISDAHQAGLIVHAWTFRAENAFLPNQFREGDPAAADYLRQHGDLAGEIDRFLDLGLDGFFTDHPDIGVEARDAWLKKPQATLIGRAVLPADTFADGPPSGSLLGTAPINGRTPPFPGQPVQGISALIEGRRGTYWAMADNGFGSKENSADFLLRVYRVRPDFETAHGGSGTVEILGFVSFADPDGHIAWPIVNEATEERLLTGADFDIESIRQDRRGEFWVGDEFGPFLLHFDDEGRLLEAPIPLPGVKSPQNPTLDGETPNLPTSRGFEGMAISPDGRTLYPTLEGALTTDTDQGRRIFYEFDIADREYTGRTWEYRMEAPEHAIGDVTAISRHELLVIERDNFEGAAAEFKQIYRVDLRETDEQGFLVKEVLVNLLAIRDPNLISLPAEAGQIGLGDPFSFPFQTIESVLPLRDGRLLVANDNNYPFSAGRQPGEPDNNEFIIIELDDGRGGRD